MIRKVCAFCTLVAAQICCAADRPSEPLDAVIARAIKPVAVPAEYKDAEKQRRAVDALRDWLPVSEAEEAEIASALQRLRTAPEGNLRSAAIMALGSRNHRELIPEYFARIETEPDQLRTFFFLMPGREKNPPLDLLRTGLASHNPKAREVVVELVEWCKARALRPEVEGLLIGDPNETVRIKAAYTLWLLGCRESVPMLRRALYGKEYAQMCIGWALANLGGDAEVEVLAPLLLSESAETRELITKGFGRLQLRDPKTAIKVLLPLLNDKAREVRIAAAIALGTLKDPVPVIRNLLKGKPPAANQDRDDLIRALGAVGNEAAVAILNELPLRDHALQKELLRLARSSSAYAVWEDYLCDPIKPNPGSDVLTTGNYDALRLLEKLADEEIFRAIRRRAAKLPQEDWEKEALDRLIQILGRRFPEAAVEPVETLQTKAPEKPSDRNKNGVPDRREEHQ